MSLWEGHGMRLLGLITALVTVFFSTFGHASDASDFRHILLNQDIDPSRAAILVHRLEDDTVWSHGGDRIDERFVAASTSKIPHTFLALENGYVESAETHFEWDGQERFVRSWNQDQTMASAYARSAVWVYQTIARDLGPETMAKGIALLKFGNQDTGAPEDVDQYWLRGPLKISAREQVQFLTSLHHEDFPLSETTYALGKSIMKTGRDDSRYAKTGWYFSDEHQDIGWYVGWHQVNVSEGQETETYVFAFNMDIDNRDTDPAKRIPVTEAILASIMK